VTLAAFLALLPMLFGMAAFGAPGDRMQVRSVFVEDQLIIRVPVRPSQMQFEWVEKKGPKCIPTAAIRAAFLSSTDHVDFVLAGRQRIRAELDEDCPALDFYEGFYLSPEDDRICVRRDVIRSRMGGSCRIERFRQLVPKVRN
jgi:hypothetical protein